MPDNRPSLTQAQWEIYEAGWDERARFRVAVCGRRFGKALALSTKLPSPDGWITMGQICVGHRLFDEKGNICRVTFATDIMLDRPCNNVQFTDGTSIIADDDHLWLVSLGIDEEILMRTEALKLALKMGAAPRIRASLEVGLPLPNGKN